MGRGWEGGGATEGIDFPHSPLIDPTQSSRAAICPNCVDYLRAVMSSAELIQVALVVKRDVLCPAVSCGHLGGAALIA